ncbi:MAG: hypothetical protein WBA54_03505 [Acidaminobacteraceae bacterium]
MLIEKIMKSCETVSIVGMAKNVGKTVTLNEIIDQACELSIVLGITSIGRDGESRDLVSDTEKPRIFITKGTIIATAEKLLNRGDLKYEVLEILDQNTILGKIVLIRATRCGYVDVSGPFTNSGIKNACEKMLWWGANLVVVDGALDRKTSASPSVTEGTILSTGAALSRDLNKVIKDTSFKMQVLNLPAFSNDRYRNIAKEMMDNGKLCIIEEDLNTIILDAKTALNSGKKLSRLLSDNSKVIVIPGSLTGSLVNDIGSHRSLRGIQLVVKDSTKIFLSEAEWLGVMSKKAEIMVMDKINLIAVTVNPLSPKGYFFESDKLISGLNKYHSDIPIIDVLMEDGYGFTC